MLRKLASFICIIFSPSLIFGVRISEGTDEGQDCFIISTTMAIYYYQKAAGAFSSIIDLASNDWIAYDTVNGQDPSSELRGLPSLSSLDSLGHPGFFTCNSVQLSDTSILTTSKDGDWEWRWDFSECQAAMTMLKKKTGKTYSFMYKGAPANSYGPDNYWGAPGVGYKPNENLFTTKDTTGYWQWMYVGDDSLNRVFYISQQTKDTLADFFAWKDGLNNDGMAAFGFGYSGSSGLLQSTQTKFIIGFLEQRVQDSTTHEQAAHVLKKIINDDSLFTLYGVSVTTHWVGPKQSVMGGWGQIIRHDIANDSVTNNTVLHAGKAFYPKFNAEGTRIAFFLKNENQPGAAVATMDINGDNFKKFDQTAWYTDTIGRFLDWPKGEWIFYSGGIVDNEIWRVHSQTGVTEKAFSIIDMNGNRAHPWAWSMNAEGSRMVFRAPDFYIYHCKVPTTYPEIITLDQNGGIYNSPKGIYGCQHSISSSGNYICYGPPVDKHATIRVKQWWDTTPYGCIKKITTNELHSWPPSQTDMGDEFNYNRWSNNSDDWLCAHEATELSTYEVCNQVLYNWVDNRQIVVTNNTGDQPEFDGAGDFHIDTSNHSDLPIMRFNETHLDFKADSGLNNPDDREVIVFNGSGGVLNDVIIAVHYPSGAINGWLQARKTSGSGNRQIITNSVNIDSLVGGIYTAIVTVASANAAVAKIYSVKLTINATKVFSKVAVYPQTISVEPGESYQFNALALDQYNDTLDQQPQSWVWETDSNATIVDGLFISDLANTYKITATGAIEGITLSGSASAVVELIALIISSPNGGESYFGGDTMNIQWSAPDTSRITTVAIDLTLNGGKTWTTLNTVAIAPSDPDWGLFQWPIPQSGSFSQECKIRVRDYQFPTYKDISDSLFEIKDKPTSLKNKHFLKKPIAIIQPRPNQLCIAINVPARYAILLAGVNGRTIIKKTGLGNARYVFSRKHLAAGVYLVKVQLVNKIVAKRFLLY